MSNVHHGIKNDVPSWEETEIKTAFHTGLICYPEKSGGTLDGNTNDILYP